MRTAEERLELLHSRACALKREREAVWMRGIGGTSCLLTVCLLALLSTVSRGGHDVRGSGYVGTSLLSESAGAYVLVAVIAFAAGVVITAALIRYREKERRDKATEEKAKY